MRQKAIIKKLAIQTEKRLQQVFNQIRKNGLKPGQDRVLFALMDKLYDLLEQIRENKIR